VTRSHYVYDAAWEQERARLAGIEALWDPGSRALLEELGLAAGHRCLEVGAGGGALVEWIAQRVGPGGGVTATDIDTRFVEPLASDVVEVRQHDITTGAPAEGAFEFAHARLVLEHLPERDAALDNLVASLRPGGRLLVEDYDWTPFGLDPPEPLADRVAAGILRFMQDAGFDPLYGRRVVSAAAAAGLEEVRGEARARVIDDSSPGFPFFRLSFEALRKPAVEAGRLDAADADAFAERLAAGGTRLITPMLVAALGRKP
jgi:SAM-dependent methyltransferase